MQVQGEESQNQQQQQQQQQQVLPVNDGASHGRPLHQPEHLGASSQQQSHGPSGKAAGVVPRGRGVSVGGRGRGGSGMRAQTGGLHWGTRVRAKAMSEDERKPCPLLLPHFFDLFAGETGIRPAASLSQSIGSISETPAQIGILIMIGSQQRTQKFSHEGGRTSHTILPHPSIPPCCEPFIRMFTDNSVAPPPSPSPLPCTLLIRNQWWGASRAPPHCPLLQWPACNLSC